MSDRVGSPRCPGLFVNLSVDVLDADQAARGRSEVELVGCDTGRVLAGTQPT
jgi:hypothetical protein